MASIEGPLKQIIFVHMDSANEPLPDGFVPCDGATYGPGLQDINPGGSYTVPNLLNKFILCADPAKAFGTPAADVTNSTLNAATGAPGPGASGGTHDLVQTISQLPIHSHPGSATGGTLSLNDPGHTHPLTDIGHTHTLTDSGHSHSTTVSTIGDHNHPVADPGHAHNIWSGGNQNQPGSGTSGYSNGGNAALSTQFNQAATTGISIGNAGGHSHTVAVNASTTGITLNSASSGISMASSKSNITGSISGITITGGNTGSGAPMDKRPRWYGLVAIIRIKN